MEVYVTPKFCVVYFGVCKVCFNILIAILRDLSMLHWKDKKCISNLRQIIIRFFMYNMSNWNYIHFLLCGLYLPPQTNCPCMKHETQNQTSQKVPKILNSDLTSRNKECLTSVIDVCLCPRNHTNSNQLKKKGKNEEQVISHSQPFSQSINNIASLN